MRQHTFKLKTSLNKQVVLDLEEGFKIEESKDDIYSQGIFHPSIDVGLVEEIHIDIHSHEIIKYSKTAFGGHDTKKFRNAEISNRK